MYRFLAMSAFMISPVYSQEVPLSLGKGFFNPKIMFTVHHTKFWIRDGEEAIIGGQNMHDFENQSNGFNNHTQDKDVKELVARKF